MELEQSIRQLAGRLSAASINYAVIGGMAMALRGIQRTTFDLDFLLMLSDLERTHKILLEEGYACVYQSENVSHYSKSGGGLTRVDVLHAFRGPSLSMLGCVLEIKRRDVERKTGSPKAAEAEMGQRPMPPRATPGQPVSLPPFGPGRSRAWAALGARGRAFQAQHPRPRLAPALLRSRRRASLFSRHTLKRVELLSLGTGCLLPVLQIEDLIGLKIQAATNDPARTLGDWSDIYRLISHAATHSRDINWPLISDYLAIFKNEAKLSELKELYARHH